MLSAVPLWASLGQRLGTGPPPSLRAGLRGQVGGTGRAGGAQREGF